MRLFAQTAPPETPSSCAAIFLADRGNVTVEMYDISLPGLYTGFQASVRVHRIGVDEDAWNWLDRFQSPPLSEREGGKKNLQIESEVDL